MALRALFKKIEKQKEEEDRKTRSPLIIRDDEEEDDFRLSSSAKPRGNGRTSRGQKKRKRARIEDESDSDEDVSTSKEQKRSIPSSKTTPSKKRAVGMKTTPPKEKEKEKKREIESASDFFGNSPVRRTTRSMRSDRSGDKTVKKLEKRKVDEEEGGERGELKTVPESPTEATVMEFSDEAVARALQEDELEMQKEKERQIHEDEEFSKTLSALDRADVVPSPSGKAKQSLLRPPAKKLKLMMDKLPVSRSPSVTPTSTPTKELPKRSPRSKRDVKGKLEVGFSRATTSLGTRGGVRYLDEDSNQEEMKDFKVEKSRTKLSPTVAKKSASKLPVGPTKTTPPPCRKQTTPTSDKGTRSTSTTPTKAAKSKSLWTTPKKSTPQPAPPPSVAGGGSGTTPSLSRTESFLRYKNRAGPRAPGSKEIPEGAVNCLEGLTFVITGVLESMEREEATDVIKKYGGKVTTNVSGRTNYVIVGEEAGESKMAKARQHGTKVIDEDGLLDLIRTRPTPSKTAGKKATAATASKVTKTTKAKSKNKSPSPAKPAQAKSHDQRPTTSTPTLSHMTSKPSTSKSAATSTPDTENLLWVDKYRPRSTKHIIGQQGDRSNAKKLALWLQNWDKNHGGGRGEGGGAKRPAWGGGSGARDDGSSFKAALLSGPPGIGKTTTATLVCEENGYAYVELNASSTRNKRTLHDQVSSLLSCLSLSALVKGGVSSGRRHALIMDEVDGMAGNEDRGGMQELIQMIRTTQVPIICICNDRQSLKIRSLANNCFDLRFQRPKVDQIKGAMMSVCFKEGLTIEPQALKEMIMASGHDVRQVMHNLSLWSASSKKMDSDSVHKAAMSAKKNSKMSPFDVVRTVFSPMDGDRELSLNEKSDLFFHDYSMASLFVQENYVNAKPHATRGNVVATLKCMAKAADSLCDGDLVERRIRSSSNWGLLPLQAFFSSVIPGEHMKGFLGRPDFPQWLGQNSKRGKFDRTLQELQRHTRLSMSCSKLEFGLDYLHHLRSKLTQPLLSQGAEGVPSVVSSMEFYDLLRSDWDLVSEIAQFTGKPDYAAQIPSKVKSAFTRAFNKESHMTHYAVAAVSKKAARRSTVDSQSDYGDMETEETGEPEQDSDSDEDLSSNPAVKVRKGSESSQNSGKGKRKMESKSNGTKKKRKIS